tara:strand:+ start:272 stop:643 length:372 start_codon:yes stop_codon:yes gene_type:complete
MAKFELKKIKTIKSEKGEIKKLSVSIGKQNKISEIYTTTVKAFSENGWRLHKEAKITLFLLSGSVFVDFKNELKTENIHLKENLNDLLVIFPESWFNIRAENQEATLLCFSSILHNPKEILRK